jgi:beta-1,4-mannosyltransferase
MDFSPAVPGLASGAAVCGEMSPVRRLGMRSGQGLTPRERIACVSAAPWNPYLRLLYEALAAEGFQQAEDPRLTLRWLWRARPRARFLHFHWPESQYRFGRGPGRLRPLLSRLKLAVFASRLATARLLGYRLVWTVHQVYPHESNDRALDRHGASLLAGSCDLLLAHDRWTADEVAARLARLPKAIAVVPHGSYIGVYPEGRPRDEVRRELGLPEESFVFLCFGEVRQYKEIELLLAAFSSVSHPSARLVVAGNVKAARIGSSIRAAAAKDPRIVTVPGFVPEARVAELFHASDAAVLPRGEAGTSGSLILALSLGLPVVAADVPTARELTGDERAGWLFQAHDASSLRLALESAAADPTEARVRGTRAREIAEGLRWTDTARELAVLLRQIDV